jgi:hypothetical protein
MRRSLLLAIVSSLVIASVALAATDETKQTKTLVQAIRQTRSTGSYRYVMTIAVVRRRYPTVALHIRGVQGPRSLFVHVRAVSSVVGGGTQVPGPQQSAFLDGPFLYEGAPNGVAVYGKIRWLRVPVSSLSQTSKALTSMRNLSLAPLLHVLGESSRARLHAPRGRFSGRVAYDDPIVHTAISGMGGGTEFRDVRYSANVGGDGYVHTIRVTGKTADGSRVLTIKARLYGFGIRVDLTPPAEGTFLDQKLLSLAE